MLETLSHGACIQLYRGGYFHPLAPDPNIIQIKDIAQALSLQCRYAGHCNYHYSVAQHSCYVHDKLPPPLRLWGLLHDADEAFGLPDLPRLVKRHPDMQFYRDAQRRIMLAVCERFGLDPVEPPEIAEVDLRVLLTEWLVLKIPGYICDRAHEGEPYTDICIRPWTQYKARIEFLTRYINLTWGKQR